MVNTRDGYKLLSMTCPLQGRYAESEGDKFVCGTHGYEYEHDGVRYTTDPDLRLKSFVVNVVDGRMIPLDLDETETSSPQAGQAYNRLPTPRGEI